jgi:hypothetical protein
MFINRKNDGTVKMTRQRATSKPHLLGMTGDDGTLFRYLQTAGEKTPKQAAAERLLELLQSEQNGTIKPEEIKFAPKLSNGVLLPIGAYHLCFVGNIWFWFYKKEGEMKVSITYRSPKRAEHVFYAGTIEWDE